MNIINLLTLSSNLPFNLYNGHISLSISTVTVALSFLSRVLKGWCRRKGFLPAWAPWRPLALISTLTAAGDPYGQLHLWLSRAATPSTCLCHLLLMACTPDCPDCPGNPDQLQLGKTMNFSTNPMGWNILSPMSSKLSLGKGLLVSGTFLIALKYQIWFSYISVTF